MLTTTLKHSTNGIIKKLNRTVYNIIHIQWTNSFAVGLVFLHKPKTRSRVRDPVDVNFVADEDALFFLGIPFQFISIIPLLFIYYQHFITHNTESVSYSVGQPINTNTFSSSLNSKRNHMTNWYKPKQNYRWNLRILLHFVVNEYALLHLRAFPPHKTQQNTSPCTTRHTLYTTPLPKQRTRPLVHNSTDETTHHSVPSKLSILSQHCAFVLLRKNLLLPSRTNEVGFQSPNPASMAR